MKRYYGQFGGQFVPETLVPALDELESAFVGFKKDKKYQRRLNALLKDYAGRPTPLYIRSTTPWARSCFRRTWARNGS
jgi:tryptophan synthase beta chain